MSVAHRATVVHLVWLVARRLSHRLPARILLITLIVNSVIPACAGCQAHPTDNQTVTAAVPPGQAPSAIGLPNPRLRVVLHNHLQVPIVLRAVSWLGCPADARRWLRPIYGSISPEAGDAITHNLMAQQLTNLRFESGLILPGADRIVDAPLTPQGQTEQLIIKYAEVGDESGWRRKVLLRDPARRESLKDTYVPVAPERMPAQSEASPYALVVTTMRQDAVAIPMFETKVSVTFTPAQASVQLTGGLNASSAALKAGRPQSMRLRSVYSTALNSWFFVAQNGEAAALRRHGNNWERIPMPVMDSIVPDGFGAQTLMLLNPMVFGDLLRVEKPAYRMYYDPGVSRVDFAVLWRVLKRARDRRIPLRFVSFDANGLGVESAIAAGVTIGAGGQWIDPPMKPAVRK